MAKPLLPPHPNLGPFIWYTFFFYKHQYFQPSLKLMLTLSRFQPQNMLRWCLKVRTAKDFFIICVWMIWFLTLRSVQEGNLFHIPTITTKFIQAQTWFSPFFSSSWGRIWALVMLKLCLFSTDLSLLMLIKRMLIKKKCVSVILFQTFFAHIWKILLSKFCSYCTSRNFC